MAFSPQEREWIQQIIITTVQQAENRQSSKQTLDKFELYDRILFGEKVTGEKGLNEKVNDMHEILIQAKGIRGFFGGLRGGLTILLAITAVLAWLGFHR